MYSLLAELSAHDLEVAETLIGVIRFLLIFLAARALAEVLVRLSLPTIVGELLAGVVIGASGFHLLIPPSAGTELNEGLVNVMSSLASIPPEAVPDVYFESFPSLQAVATLGLYALLFLTGLESELEELVAVIDAPAKTAGIRSTWKININPRVPKAQGKITPAIATVKA